MAMKSPTVREHFGIGTVPLEVSIKKETAAALESFEKSAKVLESK